MFQMNSKSQTLINQILISKHLCNASTCNKSCVLWPFRLILATSREEVPGWSGQAGMLALPGVAPRLAQGQADAWETRGLLHCGMVALCVSTTNIYICIGIALVLVILNMLESF